MILLSKAKHKEKKKRNKKKISLIQMTISDEKERRMGPLEEKYVNTG